MKKVWQRRREYLRASEAYCKINREVGEHLEALHGAMAKRDKMQPRYERARRQLDKALFPRRTIRAR